LAWELIIFPLGSKSDADLATLSKEHFWASQIAISWSPISDWSRTTFQQYSIRNHPSL
jgi:hypothetical protein